MRRSSRKTITGSSERGGWKSSNLRDSRTKRSEESLDSDSSEVPIFSFLFHAHFLQLEVSGESVEGPDDMKFSPMLRPGMTKTKYRNTGSRVPFLFLVHAISR